jgi:hypothetical protein
MAVVTPERSFLSTRRGVFTLLRTQHSSRKQARSDATATLNP